MLARSAISPLTIAPMANAKPKPCSRAPYCSLVRCSSLLIRCARGASVWRSMYIIMVARSSRPQTTHFQDASREFVGAVVIRSAVPGFAVPLENALHQGDDICGEGAEQNFAFLGGRMPRKADVARFGAILGDPAAAGGLEGIAPIDILELLDVAGHQARIDPQHHRGLKL